jgi:hypothetical protein
VSLVKILALTCALGSVSAQTSQAATPGATQAVVDWNVTALGAAASSNGVREGHNLALTQAAVFDAANSISRRYDPYRVRI